MIIIYENSELFWCTRNRSCKWDRIFDIVPVFVTSRHVIPTSQNMQKWMKKNDDEFYEDSYSMIYYHVE